MTTHHGPHAPSSLSPTRAPFPAPPLCAPCPGPSVVCSRTCPPLLKPQAQPGTPSLLSACLSRHPFLSLSSLLRRKSHCTCPSNPSLILPRPCSSPSPKLTVAFPYMPGNLVSTPHRHRPLPFEDFGATTTSSPSPPWLTVTTPAYRAPTLAEPKNRTELTS
jgi:hypothetical protein